MRDWASGDGKDTYVKSEESRMTQEQLSTASTGELVTRLSEQVSALVKDELTLA